jgi:PAS domain S-box-containing protein
LDRIAEVVEHGGIAACSNRGGTLTDFTLLAAIVDQAPDGIILADPQGRIRVWNRGAERLFGHAASEVVGERLDIIIPEPLRRAHWEAFDRSIASGRTKYDGRAMTTRSMHKDGRKLYVDLSFALITDTTGAVSGALAIARDCTARHESERVLRERVAALEKQLAAARPA